MPHRHVTQREIARLAPSGRYRAVVCGTAGRVALPAAWQGARARGTPFVLWSALWAHPRTPAHLLAGAPLMAALYRSADAVVAYGPHVAAFAKARGASNIHIAPQAVDNAFWSVALAPQRTVPFLAVFLGRPSRGKGATVLLDAWRESGIGASAAALVLVGVGTGPARNPAGGAVVFAGPQPAEQVRNFLAAADVCVIPSLRTRSFREPWGLVANEAMNQSTPVIASDEVGAVAGGLVRHERNGLVVAPATCPPSPPRCAACTTTAICARSSAQTPAATSPPTPSRPGRAASRPRSPRYGEPHDAPADRPHHPRRRAAAPAGGALASGKDVIRDCTDDEVMSKTYTQKEYRDALKRSRRRRRPVRQLPRRDPARPAGGARGSQKDWDAGGSGGGAGDGQRRRRRRDRQRPGGRAAHVGQQGRARGGRAGARTAPAAPVRSTAHSSTPRRSARFRASARSPTCRHRWRSCSRSCWPGPSRSAASASDALSTHAALEDHGRAGALSVPTPAVHTLLTVGLAAIVCAVALVADGGLRVGRTTPAEIGLILGGGVAVCGALALAPRRERVWGLGPLMLLARAGGPDGAVDHVGGEPVRGVAGGQPHARLHRRLRGGRRARAQRVRAAGAPSSARSRCRPWRSAATPCSRRSSRRAEPRRGLRPPARAVRLLEQRRPGGGARRPWLPVARHTALGPPGAQRARLPGARPARPDDAAVVLTRRRAGGGPGQRLLARHRAAAPACGGPADRRCRRRRR